MRHTVLNPNGFDPAGILDMLDINTLSDGTMYQLTDCPDFGL